MGKLKYPMKDNVVKLEIGRSSTIMSNINDILDELRNDNIEAFAIVYTRKDGSTRTALDGYSRVALVGTLEQLKFDILNEESKYNT